MNETELEIFERTGVYAIRNLHTRKVYVGSTIKSFRRRWCSHRNYLRKGIHPTKHLQSSWQKYGEESFEFVILEVCSPERCLIREQYWIDELKAFDRRSGYNGRPKAESNIGAKFGPMREEHRLKIGEANRRAWATTRTVKTHSPEVRIRISKACKGVNRSESFKEKIRTVRTGWKLSELTKQRISQALKGGPGATGRVVTEETKIKISAARTGKPLTQEHRAKLSAAKKGKPWTDARRAARVGN